MLTQTTTRPMLTRRLLAGTLAAAGLALAGPIAAQADAGAPPDRGYSAGDSGRTSGPQAPGCPEGFCEPGNPPQKFCEAETVPTSLAHPLCFSAADAQDIDFSDDLPTPNEYYPEASTDPPSDFSGAGREAAGAVAGQREATSAAATTAGP